MNIRTVGGQIGMPTTIGEALPTLDIPLQTLSDDETFETADLAVCDRRGRRHDDEAAYSNVSK
jgi:hypothetical protein